MRRTIFKAVPWLSACIALTSCSPSNEVSPIQQEYAKLASPAIADSDPYRVYYEVFVRSFSDSNGDGIGDLQGLTQKLDYLNDGNPRTFSDLGVTGIWLMPINPSPSYHKYDVTDFYGIDPEYGTMQDFETLIKEAHKRGIKVLMDLVANHTSAQHPWFTDAKASKVSTYRSYYEWAGEGPFNPDVSTVKWGHPVWNDVGGSKYYVLFWDQMPDLNYENQKVRDEMKYVAQFWLQKGVDGFRLDAASHIYDDSEYPEGTDITKKNVEWWQEFKNACLSVNPNAYLVGEVWEDDPSTRAPYFQPLTSTFDFSLGTIISGAVLAERDVSHQFNRRLLEIYQTYQKANPNFVDAPFLSNHDQNRIMSELGGDVAKAKLAASIYLTLPGNPFIYYGEEIGMLGGKPDENIRLPFKWYATPKSPQTSWEDSDDLTPVVAQEDQQKDPQSLLTLYKELIRIRQSSPTLMKGDFQGISSQSEEVIAYARGSGKAIVIHNLSKTVQTTALTGYDLTSYKLYFSSSAKGTVKLKGQNITIPPQTTVILRK